MLYHDQDLTHIDPEVSEMWRLLIDSYAVSRRPLNWRVALFENWYYASRYMEPTDYFASRAHLWRTSDGELAGFVIRYYGTTHLQVNTAHRQVEDVMLGWAERNWAGDRACIRTRAFDYDSKRRTLLSQRGYSDQGTDAVVRLYELNRPYGEPRLPPGFRFSSVAETGDYAGRIALENAIWNAELDDAWFRGKRSAPSYALDRDLLVISPDDSQVATSLVWIDAANRMAEIDPLGTHPEYRRQGLARALVLESFRRMKADGLHGAYIGADGDNEPANRLYAALGPVETVASHLWAKIIS